MNVGGDANRRVRITKSDLRTALYELLQQKALNKITVREITERANVSRGTFYLHYQDVYDMVEKIEDEYMERIQAELMHAGESNLDSLNILFERLLRLIRDESQSWEILSLSNGFAGVKQKIYDLLLFRTQYNLAKMFDVTKDQEAYMTALVISGVFGLAEQWLKDGAREDPSVLAAILAAGTEAEKAALAATQQK